jgi:predicted DNA-binding transcriptional regulator YafY
MNCWLKKYQYSVRDNKEKFVMAMSEKKSRILYIKKYLEEQTDEVHPAVISDIVACLADAGITANRRTVTQDIEQLMESGIDVVCNKSRPNKYFIGGRIFEAPELKLLIDAAQASKFLTAKRSRALISKLLAHTSRHQAAELERGIYFDDRTKPKNEIAYITADLLHTAISAKKRVQFMYYEYAPDKRKTYKHKRQIYEFSPWHFVWDSDRYYIIGYSENHGKAITFRVDRIAASKLTELDAVPAPEGFDLADFVKSVFQMYDGPLLDVTLICENALMKTIIDRYGEGVHTEKAGTGHFYSKVSVYASKTFYGWVFASDGAVRIVAPTEAVEAYSDMLKRASQPFVPPKAL